MGKRTTVLKKNLEFIKKNVPTATVLSVAAFATVLVLFILSLNSPQFADFVNNTLGTTVRAVMAAVSHIIPFSIFEAILLLLLPLSILLVVFLLKDKRSRVERIRTVFFALAIVGFMLSGYILVMSSAYHTTPLYKKIGIEDMETTTEDVYEVTKSLVVEINSLADNLPREDGVAKSGKTIYELSEEISKSYETVRKTHPIFHNFPSRAKPIALSGIMSDMGITGIYTYFTGEANVNIEYPDYYLAFVAAHEFAHQRGIMREDEANFMAYLATTSSTDEFLRYSGNLYMYIYMANALYSADKDLYTELAAELSDNAKADIRASNAVTIAHEDSFLGVIFDKINDIYLKSNGTAGVVSYSYVVKLVTAYNKEK